MKVAGAKCSFSFLARSFRVGGYVCNAALHYRPTLTKALCASKKRGSFIIILSKQANKVRRDVEPKDAPDSTR